MWNITDQFLSIQFGNEAIDNLQGEKRDSRLGLAREMQPKVILMLLCAACAALFILNYETVKDIVLSQNGGYSSWSSWSSCSKTCGGGRRVKVRNCTNPKPRGLGRSCLRYGASYSIELCNDHRCPIDKKPGL